MESGDGGPGVSHKYMFGFSRWIYESWWFSLKKYKTSCTNTPKIDHSLSKARANNWDLTVISNKLPLYEHKSSFFVTQVSLSRYHYLSFWSPTKLQMRWYCELNSCNIFPLWTEIIRHTLEFRRNDIQYYLLLMILPGFFILQSPATDFSSHLSEISLLLSPATSSNGNTGVKYSYPNLGRWTGSII